MAASPTIGLTALDPVSDVQVLKKSIADKLRQFTRSGSAMLPNKDSSYACHGQRRILATSRCETPRDTSIAVAGVIDP